MNPKMLRLRNEFIWSLDEDGHTGKDIADCFNMEKSWISRIIKQKPRGFKSSFLPVVK